MPFGDQAADDLLIQDAKHLHLMHGNYSRFGFYHPGPWFLSVAALGEIVFYDWTGLFRSALGAQAYALGLTHAAAFALCLRLWLLHTGRAGIALLCTTIVLATMLAPFTPLNPLVAPWTPYTTMAAALFAATGLAGCILRGTSWLPLLALGSAQMMHGHASLLGIVPAMLGVAALVLACAGRLRPTPGWLARHRADLVGSLAIVAVFAAPILADTVLHRPGQWLLYWQFLGTLPPLPAWSAFRFEAGFVPLGGAWLMLLLLPARARPRRADTIWLAGAVLFAAAVLPGFLYSWRGVDDPAHRYLLAWLTPFVGMSLAACLLHASQALPRFVRRPAYGAAWLAALAMIARVQPALTAGAAASPALQRAVRAQLALPPPPGGGRIELVLDHTQTAWGPSWTETVTLLAALKRAGRRDLCVSAMTWHLLFGQENRCDLLRDSIVARDRVTLWADLAPGPAIRLEASGLAPLPEVTTGPAQKVAEAIGRGLEFGPGWSGLETQGVWTDGGTAYLGFATAFLPERFDVRLAGRLLAPASGVQRVTLSDDRGAVLGILQGSGAASLTMTLRRPVDGGRMRLGLSVAHPVTPVSLGMGKDTRALGFQLLTVQFAPDPSAACFTGPGPRATAPVCPLVP